MYWKAEQLMQEPALHSEAYYPLITGCHNIILYYTSSFAMILDI